MRYHVFHHEKFRHNSSYLFLPFWESFEAIHGYETHRPLQTHSSEESQVCLTEAQVIGYEWACARNANWFSGFRTAKERGGGVYNWGRERHTPYIRPCCRVSRQAKPTLFLVSCANFSFFTLMLVNKQTIRPNAMKYANKSLHRKILHSTSCTVGFRSTTFMSFFFVYHTNTDKLQS